MFKIRKHILEGHIFDHNLKCMNCHLTAVDLDATKNRYNIKVLTCKEIQNLLLINKERLRRSTLNE